MLNPDKTLRRVNTIFSISAGGKGNLVHDDIIRFKPFYKKITIYEKLNETTLNYHSITDQKNVASQNTLSFKIICNLYSYLKSF